MQQRRRSISCRAESSKAWPERRCSTHPSSCNVTTSSNSGASSPRWWRNTSRGDSGSSSPVRGRRIISCGRRRMANEAHIDDTDRLMLSDLLNRVLDRGVVISGSIIVSVAGVDLIRVGLNIFIAAIETELQKAADRERSLFHADLPVLHPPRGR